MLKKKELVQDFCQSTKFARMVFQEFRWFSRTFKGFPGLVRHPVRYLNMIWLTFTWHVNNVSVAVGALCWKRENDNNDEICLYIIGLMVIIVVAGEIRGGSRKVAKSLQESILIDFDFIWKVLLSHRSFATLLDPPLEIPTKCQRLITWCWRWESHLKSTALVTSSLISNILLRKGLHHENMKK